MNLVSMTFESGSPAIRALSRRNIRLLRRQYPQENHIYFDVKVRELAANHRSKQTRQEPA